MRASPSTPNSRWRNHAVFPVVGRIAVIVVLGIVSAMALPRLTDRSAFQARGFEDEVFAALRHARALAVASGCAVQVSIAGNGYTLNQQRSEEPTSELQSLMRISYAVYCLKKNHTTKLK